MTLDQHAPTLVERAAKAKACCNSWGWRLERENDEPDELLFNIVVPGPPGVRPTLDLPGSNSGGATLSAVEEVLEEMSRQFSRAIEQHACEECDETGMCSFWRNNKINAVNRMKDADKTDLRAFHDPIQAELEKDLQAANVSEIVPYRHQGTVRFPYR